MVRCLQPAMRRGQPPISSQASRLLFPALGRILTFLTFWHSKDILNAISAKGVELMQLHLRGESLPADLPQNLCVGLLRNVTVRGKKCSRTI